MDLIPEELRRAHEDGKVVFFCGAGISVPAGLPSFKELVESVLTDLLPRKEDCQPGTTESLARSAFCGGRYDEALDILESPRQGGYAPKSVREKVREHLTRRPKTLDKHLIMTQLADLDKERGRLVTTNFDCLFEKAATKLRRQEGSGHRMVVHVAPALPPAESQTFRGLAYLHGKLKSSPDDRRLVLTTADFGKAYMVEGWARRFSVDLFRHYHVVFIGYSVEDPMMRYLVSALVAIRQESPQQFKQPYAFAGKGENEQSQKQQWKLKGIEPLLYDNDAGHRELWRTLKAWADDYRRGLTGRRQKVVRLGRLPPKNENGPAVRDMVWALKDVALAKYFAERRPHPGWIAPLQKKGLLGLLDDGKPITAPLASRRLTDCLDLHGVTRELSRWIAESLNSQEALDWALSQGGVLHEELRRQIRIRLDNQNTDIRPAFRKIWQVLANDGYAHALAEKYENSNDWLPPPRLAPNAAFAKRDFLNRIRPLPIFKVKDDSWGWSLDGQKDPERPEDWCEIEIELVHIRGHGYKDVNRFRDHADDWEGALAAMADDLTTRLQEAMDWFYDLAASDTDRTYSQYPSISEHKQNRHLRTWTQLIELSRDSYDALISTGDKSAAERLVQRWQSLPYPLFRRLALYAATQEAGMHGVNLGLEILLEGPQPALWDIHVHRETLRFLRKRGKDIPKRCLDRLTEEILKGPSRYCKDPADDECKKRHDWEIRLRLYKLTESGVALSPSAQGVYDRIQRDLLWKPHGDLSEEFLFFTYSPDTFTYSPDTVGFPDENRVLEDFTGMSVERFIQWSATQTDSPWECGGGWRRFVENNIQSAVNLLKGASDNKSWPISLWRTVLSVPGDKKEEGETADALKREVAGLLTSMPSEKLAALDIQSARWLEKEWLKLDEAQRRELWRSIWNASLTEAVPEDNVNFNATLNHAGGILGNVLGKELAECIPKISTRENPGLPDRLQPDFELIAEENHPSGKLARARLAPMLHYIYRIAPDWTDHAFFQRMDPDKTGFEPHLWEGYFWNPHCTADLLAAFKKQFFNILGNLDRIPESVRHHGVALFVHLAVPPDRGIDTDEAKRVLWNLGIDGLVEAAEALRDMLEGAGKKSVALWRDTIGPWFKEVWPKRCQDRSKKLSEQLAGMAMESGDAFPCVVAIIEDIMMREEYSASLLCLRDKEALVRRHPDAALTLVSKLVHDGSERQRMGELLKWISEAKPELGEKDCFRRLDSMTNASTC